jgi:O-antigen ligase
MSSRIHTAILPTLLAVLVGVAMLPYGSVTPWAQAMVVLGSFTIALLLVCMPPQPPPRKPRKRTVPILLAILLVWQGYQYIFVLDHPAARTTFMVAQSLWVAFLAIIWVSKTLCASRHAIRVLITGLATVGTIQAAIGILGLRMDLGRYSEFVSGGRAAGTFSSGNSFGGFIAIALLATLGISAASLPAVFEHINRRRGRLLHCASRGDYCIFTGLALMVAPVLMILALLLSGSRGAGVAGAVTMVTALAWIYASQRTKGNSSRSLLALFIGLALAITALGIGGTYVVAERRFAELGDAAEASLPRTSIWRGTLSLVADNPLGVGAGSFPARFPMYQPRGFNLARVRHAHNDYLELISELGIPGAIALFSLLLVLLVSSGKYLLRPHDGKTIWLRRCAFLAVIAGLIHATVDFNLSSRPGVSILFAALLGAAISRPERSRRGHSTAQRPPSRRTTSRRAPTTRILVPIAYGVALILLVMPRARDAMSSVLIETSLPAFNGETSRYFWLKTPAPTRDAAWARLSKATKLSPKNPHGYVALAQARLAEHHERRVVLADQLMAKTPGLTKALANHHVTLVLRQDEAIVLKEAKQHLETALSMAPKHVDANAHLARVLGGHAQLSPNQEAYRAGALQLLRQVDKVLALAPNDAFVHTHLFRGLFRAYCSPYAREEAKLLPELRDRLMNVGRAAMWLSSSDVGAVLTGWKTAGIEPHLALASGELSLDVIWKIYQHYNTLGDAPTAMLALNTLADARGSSDSSRSLFNKTFGETQQDRYRQLTIREQCRWLLRTRQFRSYIDLRSDRDAALRRYVSEQLSHSGADKAPRAYLLALGRLWDDRGLDPKHMMEYCTLARQHGAPDAKCAAIAAPLALFGEPADELKEYLRSTGAHLYAHRLTLLGAKEAIQGGRLDETRTALQSLAGEQPKDPDVHATIVRHAPDLGLSPTERKRVLRDLADIAPPHMIGMQFMGGRCELMGLSADPGTLRTHWRFRSPIPSDLQVLVLLRDEGNRTLYSRAIDFTKTGGLDFGSGAPRLGMVFDVNTPLPLEKASRCSRLTVGLRRKSTGQCLHSSEGLPYCEIYDWFELVYTRHAFRDQTAPSPDVRRALGITAEYKRDHFSHNLGRIFDEPEFHPLLAGERKTTIPPTWQPCLAASGLIERAAMAAREAFDTDPYRQMFALGINDGQDWCECEPCRDLCPPDQRAMPPSQRWWSTPYWSFVNKVAIELEKTHPDKRIGAIAYSNVAEPPTFELNDNVTVYVCQDAGSHFDPREQKRDADRLRAWTKICSDVGLYTYAGLASWIFPRYCRDEIAQAILTASELGISGFYIEDAWVEWIDGPFPWIVTKLLKDPTLDPKLLQQQFCGAAYGPAAGAMDAYFNLLQKVWRSAPGGKWFDGLYHIDEQARRYPPAIRKEMQSFIQDARKLAMGNSAILKRIAAVSEPLAIAEAFATENDLMQQLREPMQSIPDLNATETLLIELRDAIDKRHTLLDALDQHEWGAGIKRALAASRVEPTIDRWDRKQNTLIKAAEEEIRVIRNVLTGISSPPARKTENLETRHE